MTDAPFPILYEDNHLLAVEKPAGLPTMGVAADQPSVLSLAKKYIKDRYHKPGNVYLGVVSRLDARVSGVVLIARTSKAAKRLSEQFRRREVEKIYWAIVHEQPQPAATQCIDWMRKDERHRRMHICPEAAPGAKHARMTYRTIQALEQGTLLEISLETGRKHQIRLQMSHRGHPILGDRKYGSRQSFPVGIALLARRLVINHPVGGATLRIESPPPGYWPKECLGP